MTETTRRCPACNGTGYNPGDHDCAECNGTGKLSQREYEALIPSAKLETTHRRWSDTLRSQCFWKAFFSTWDVFGALERMQNEGRI